MLSVSTILHPTDFSSHSHNAFWVACALSRDYRARLTVLHVMPARTTEILALAQLGLGETGNIKENLWSTLQRLQPDSAISVEHRLEDGEPVTEILRVAQESQADLIV